MIEVESEPRLARVLGFLRGAKAPLFQLLRALQFRLGHYLKPACRGLAEGDGSNFSHQIFSCMHWDPSIGRAAMPPYQPFGQTASAQSPENSGRL